MVLIFCTKRNTNGNRRYLKVSTTSRTWTTEKEHWLCRDDFIEVSARDFKRTMEELENDPDFTRV